MLYTCILPFISFENYFVTTFQSIEYLGQLLTCMLPKRSSTFLCKPFRLVSFLITLHLHLRCGLSTIILHVSIGVAGLQPTGSFKIKQWIHRKSVFISTSLTLFAIITKSKQIFSSFSFFQYSCQILWLYPKLAKIFC